VRRRACAALLLCGPLVAGCGTAARLDFKGHSRPATPVDVSVYVGGGAGETAIDPHLISGGPVRLLVTNQASRPETVALLDANASNRVVAVTPPVPGGGTAQIKLTLASGRYLIHTDVGTVHESSGPALWVGPHTRTGDNDLLQP
jgi:hypothetical protein